VDGNFCAPRRDLDLKLKVSQQEQTSPIPLKTIRKQKVPGLSPGRKATAHRATAGKAGGESATIFCGLAGTAKIL